MARLLIIDDSQKWTKLVARMATPLGFDVECCNDPTLALEAFVAFTPDVVMLDMCMPEKDGIEVLNEILLTDIPAKVVLTSGYGAGFLGLASNAAEFHGRTDISTLSKPFRSSELAEALLDLGAETRRLAARIVPTDPAGSEELVEIASEIAAHAHAQGENVPADATHNRGGGATLPENPVIPCGPIGAM